MSTSTAQAEVIDLSDRLAKRTDVAPAPVAAPPKWRRTASGAITVAHTTGIGTAELVRRVWDYEQGGEHARRIAHARQQEDAGLMPVDEAEELVSRLRRERREIQEARHVEPRTIWGATGATSTATLLTLLGTSTSLGAAALLGVIGGGLYGYGRRVLRQRSTVTQTVSPRVVVQGEVIPDQAVTGEVDEVVDEFEQLVRQALTEDLGVNLANLQVTPAAWGSEVHIQLSRMTPAVISNQLDLLEACLPDVRTNSILMQQSKKARNRCVLRIPGPDPWRAVPELPYRAPKSLRTSEVHQAQIGADMSGLPLALPVQRTNINFVGKSRSGKSTLLRAELDVLTATEDQIVIGIDLGSAGAGFGGLRKGMHAVATTPEAASAVLQWALDLGKGRPALFDDLGMVENWETSAKRPGIKLIVDEFPALVAASRKGYIDPDSDSGRRIPWGLDDMLAELAVTSAKSDVTMLLAGQGVTREKIKDNTWVTELQAQVMAACDVNDVKQILGGGAMAEGWRPDRLLPAMGEEVNDASVAYVMAGSQYCEPIPYRASIVPNDELTRRGTERAEAGLVELDAESENLSDISLADIIAICAGREFVKKSAAPELLANIREVFDAAGDPAGMTPDEISEALAEREPAQWASDQYDSAQERTAGLQSAITSALEPAGLAWKRDKIQRDGRRCYYRLRDLQDLLTALEKRR